MSFVDHFSGKALNPRWTAVVAGAGRVTVADSTASMIAPAAKDAAAIYRTAPVNKAVSQLFMAAVSSNPLSVVLSIVTKATAPIAEPAAAFASRVVMQVVGATNGYQLTYVDVAGVTQYWNSATNVWTTTPTLALSLAVAADFHVVGVEFDAEFGNSRFRLIGAHQTIASGFSPAQGLRIFALTDWVNWSVARASTSPLWFVLGDPRTDVVAATCRVEWVRSADGPREYLYTNAKEGGRTGAYGIRTSWGYDGRFFVPKDRTTVDVPGKDPWVVFDGSTYHLFFYKFELPRRIARATATSPLGPWTFRDYVTPPVQGRTCVFPAVVYTPWDVPQRQWQCLTTPLSDAQPPPQAMHLFTAPAANGPWTDHGGAVLGLGPVPVHRNGQWEVWYSTNVPVRGGTAWVTGCRASGPSLEQLAEDGAGVRLELNKQRQALSADLNGSQASVIDTSAFAVDMPCYLAIDNTGDNWAESTIRSITPTIALELMHRVMGATVAAGTIIYGGAAGNQQIRQIRRVGNEWWVYLTTFAFARQEPTFKNNFQESCSLLIVPNGKDLADMSASMYSWVDSPIVYHGSWGNQHSNENCSLINPATPQSTRR